jgi:hypothetical protein
MKTLLLLPLLLMLVPPGQQPATGQESSPVTVLAFKWSKSRQTIEKADSGIIPAPAMIAANKNHERQRRGNAPAGERDPNLDTIDGRSAALERSVQESRSPKSVVDGFAYRAKVQNASQKVIEVLFWEYQFIDSANPTIVARRQFLCGVNLKAGKEKELKAFSVSGPSDVVSVGSLANKSGSPFQERVVINGIEYADGTIWQRQDWNFGEVRLSVSHALQGPWAPDMCKGL